MGWDDVIMHLRRAQHIASGLDRNAYWNSYVDDIDCDAAIESLIDSATTELEATDLEPQFRADLMNELEMGYAARDFA